MWFAINWNVIHFHTKEGEMWNPPLVSDSLNLANLQSFLRESVRMRSRNVERGIGNLHGLPRESSAEPHSGTCILERGMQVPGRVVWPWGGLVWSMNIKTHKIHEGDSNPYKKEKIVKYCLCWEIIKYISHNTAYLFWVDYRVEKAKIISEGITDSF